jgi:hypothetical protein
MVSVSEKKNFSLVVSGKKKLAADSRQAKKLTQVPEMVFDSS